MAIGKVQPQPEWRDKPPDVKAITSALSIDTISTALEKMPYALRKRRVQESKISWRDSMFNYREPPEYHYNKLRSGVIHPRSGFSTCWDIFNMFFVFLCVIIIPFDMAFDLDFKSTKYTMFVIDIFFVLDVIVNFITAYYNHEGNLEDRRCHIAWQYLMSWFLLDVVSAGAGVLTILQEAAPSVRWVTSVRMLRVGRVLKLMRLAKIRAALQAMDDLGPTTFVMARILKVLFLTSICVHFSGCGWYILCDGGRDIHGYDLESTSWCSRLWGSDFSDNIDWQERYLVSIYWAFVTVTTVGYGDITPGNSNERLFAMCICCVGTGMFAYITSEISTIASKQNSTTLEYHKRMQTVEQFMKHYRLHPRLKTLLRDHYRDFGESQCYFDKADLLKGLSLSTQQQIERYLMRDVLQRHALFTQADDDVVMAAVKVCHHRFAEAGDCLVKRGEVYQALFVIEKGEVVRHKQLFQHLPLPGDVDVEGDLSAGVDADGTSRTGIEGEPLPDPIDTHGHAPGAGAREVAGVVAVDTSAVAAAAAAKAHAVYDLGAVDVALSATALAKLGGPKSSPAEHLGPGDAFGGIALATAAIAEAEQRAVSMDASSGAGGWRLRVVTWPKPLSLTKKWGVGAEHTDENAEPEAGTVIRGAVSRHTIKAVRPCELYLLVERDLLRIVSEYPGFADNYERYCKHVVQTCVPAREQEEAEAEEHREITKRALKKRAAEARAEAAGGEHAGGAHADTRATMIAMGGAWERASALGVHEQLSWLGGAVLRQQQANADANAQMARVQALLAAESARNASVQTMLQQLLVHQGLPLSTALHSPLKQPPPQPLAEAQAPPSSPETLALANDPAAAPAIDGLGAMGDAIRAASPTAAGAGASARSGADAGSGSGNGSTPQAFVAAKQQRYELKKAEIRQKILERKRNAIRQQHQSAAATNVKLPPLDHKQA